MQPDELKEYFYEVGSHCMSEKISPNELILVALSKVNIDVRLF
jgi:hypothetical protein